MISSYAALLQEDDSVLEQYIDDNPCKRVRSLKVDNKIVRYLSDEEKPRLLKAAKAIGGKFYLKVLMALITGMRKGELERLRCDDIDFDKGLALLANCLKVANIKNFRWHDMTWSDHERNCRDSRP